MEEEQKMHKRITAETIVTALMISEDEGIALGPCAVELIMELREELERRLPRSTMQRILLQALGADDASQVTVSKRIDKPTTKPV